MALRNPQTIALTVREVADALVMSPTTVRRRLRDGQIRGVEIGGRLIVLDQAVADAVAIARGELDPERAAWIAAEAAEAERLAREQAENHSRWHDPKHPDFKRTREEYNAKLAAVEAANRKANPMHGTPAAVVQRRPY